MDVVLGRRAHMPMAGLTCDERGGENDRASTREETESGESNEAQPLGGGEASTASGIAEVWTQARHAFMGRGAKRN